MKDLSHWDITEAFGQFEAAALIAGIDPADVGHDENWKLLMPISGRMKDCYQLGLKRCQEGPTQDVLSSVAMEKGQVVDSGSSDFEQQRFTRKELSRWLSAIEVKSGYPFDRDRSADTPGLAGRWPWGNHHTELLGHLEAAARRFWVEYDPSDTTTAPTNVTVSDWLKKERKVSGQMADAIASMLRPDGLPTGPRK